MFERLISASKIFRQKRLAVGLLLAGVVPPVSLLGNEISLEQSISQTTIAYEDSVVLHLTLSWSGSQFRYRFPSPLAPKADRLRVKGYSSSVSSAGSGDSERTTKVYRLVFVPTSAGSAEISSVTIPYLVWPDSIPGEVTTEQMSVNIAEPKKRAPQSDSPFPLAYALLAVVPLGAGGALLYRRMRRRSTLPEKKHEQVFLEALDKIKSDAMGDFKKYQSGVYALLASYFRDRFDLKSEQLDTDDPLATVPEKLLGSSDRATLARWYSRARADRFKPVTPEPGELVRLDSEIRALFTRLTN